MRRMSCQKYFRTQGMLGNKLHALLNPLTPALCMEPWKILCLLPFDHIVHGLGILPSQQSHLQRLRGVELDTTSNISDTPHLKIRRTFAGLDADSSGAHYLLPSRANLCSNRIWKLHASQAKRSGLDIRKG